MVKPTESQQLLMILAAELPHRPETTRHRWAKRLNTQEKSCYHYETASGRSNWPNRDPAGEFWGGAILYGFIGNQPTNYYDYLGLAVGDGCGCAPDGNELVIVADDFGRECCEHLIETVNYNYRSYDGADSGHAQITTPNGRFGWGPTEANPFTTQPGTLYDGGNLPNNISYSACPESLSALEDGIHDNSEGDYNFLNIGAPNCSGWACDRITDAGGEAPFTNGPFLPPGGYGDISDTVLDGVGGAGDATEDFLFDPPPAVRISPYK